MFTGLVECLATVAEIVPEPPGIRLVLDAPALAAEAMLGESIAVNGCCLSVVGGDSQTLAFQAGPETLARTNLGELRPAAKVNLERSLRVGDRLGGHFVTGHIDAVAEVVSRDDQGEWATICFRVPPGLTRQMAAKGSIALDGVSLTLVAVERDQFSVQLIPHTLAVTTLGSLTVGSRVNVETDLLAKYVQQLAD